MNYITKYKFGRFCQRRGAALIEMALAAAVLIPLTFGAIEFSDAFFKKNTLQGAAREGARASIVAGATPTTARDAARAVMTAAGFSSADYNTKYFIDVTNTSGASLSSFSTLPAGTPIRVRVYGEWGKLGFSPYGFLSSSKVVNGVAVMRKESPAS